MTSSKRHYQVEYQIKYSKKKTIKNPKMFFKKRHIVYIVILMQILEMYFQLKLKKEGNVLFNDALNTFYLRLYGVEDIK